MIIFHAINKTGSMSMAYALHAALSEMERQSYVFGLIGQPYNVQEIARKQETKLLIDHNLLGKIPDANVFCFLREPTLRMMSVYHWLQSRHGDFIGNKSLEEFMSSGDYRFHLQYYNIATDFSLPPEQISNFYLKSSTEQIAERSAQIFENIDFVGVTEYYELSLLCLFKRLGLNCTPEWPLDKRNAYERPGEDMRNSIRLKIMQDHPIEYDLYYRSIERLFSYASQERMFGQAITYERRNLSIPISARSTFG